MSTKLKIAFVFYGILSGAPGSGGTSNKDYRHCWPNIKKMLIDPFVAQGHEAKIYFSTYPIEDSSEFHELVKPDDVIYSQFEGSDPFTTKGQALKVLDNVDSCDLVVLSRSDVHYSRSIADENIDLTKFNFLFPEGGGWWESWRFTCDNFYMFPFHMRKSVDSALHDTYGWPRGKPMVDTHALINKLADYIPTSQMHFVSLVPEFSDVNSFFTCCRDGLPDDGRGGHIHPEVKERFGYK